MLDVTGLWSKNNGLPVDLPWEDMDEDGYMRTDLHTRAGAAEELGWVRVTCPPTISRMQLNQQLEVDGKYDTVVAAMSDPGMPNSVKIYYKDTSDFHRTHPVLLQFAENFGYDTDAKLDAFFTSAALIT